MICIPIMHNHTIVIFACSAMLLLCLLWSCSSRKGAEGTPESATSQEPDLAAHGFEGDGQARTHALLDDGAGGGGETGEAVFATVLDAVAVGVIVDLADHVRAVEVRVAELIVDADPDLGAVVADVELRGERPEAIRYVELGTAVDVAVEVGWNVDFDLTVGLANDGIVRCKLLQKRLSLTPNGNVRYQLKTPYRDGTTHVIFEPLDFMYRMYGMPRAQGCAGAVIARLAALVPKPRVNLTRFHGVFA